MLHFFKDSQEHNLKNQARLYVKPHFSVNNLRGFLSDFYNRALTFRETSKGFIVDIDIHTNNQKETVHKTRVQCLQNETVIYVIAESVLIDLSSYKETTKPASFDLRKQAFFVYLQTQLLILQNDQLYALHNKEQLPFVTTIDLEIQNFLFHQFTPQEYVLSILGVNDVIVKDANKHVSKKEVEYFIVTSKRQFLLQRDIKHDFQIISIARNELTIFDKTGKDLVSTQKLSFYTEFMNDYLFHELLPVIKSAQNRLEVFADLLVKKYSKKEAHLALASRIFHLQNDAMFSSLNTLKADVAVLFKNLSIHKQKEETLFAILTKHATSDFNFGDNLVTIAQNWQLSFKTQKELLKIIRPLQQKSTAKHSIAFHQHVYEQFQDKKRKETETFEFNLNYARHLTNAERFSEAVALYKIIYQLLPDDSITDLLPTKNTNLLEGEGGQQLKITVLEAILYNQKQLGENTSETIHKLAELQPLVHRRIDDLLTIEALKYKAKAIQETFQESNFSSLKTHSTSLYQPLNKKEILQKVVPSCFKDAKGFFDSLHNFIAALNPPDYDAVISFSDELNSTNYPEITSRISAICHALQIQAPECYIGRGNYSDVVIGVEGKPAFLIIGIDFLDSKSSQFLEINSLLFLIAIELAHIYFEHSKITSTDVWRGATDKGFTVVNLLLSVLPFAGNIGTIFGNIANVEKYKTIINRVEQVANVAEKGKEIMEVSERYNLNPFKKEKSQQDHSENLLITSRLMEIVADKVALLFCDDVKAAVKALVYSKPNFETSQKLIDTHGLETFLAQTNEAGEFIHQELIIRIRNVFSFYLSDTFETLKKQLHN